MRPRIRLPTVLPRGIVGIRPSAARGVIGMLPASAPGVMGVTPAPRADAMPASLGVVGAALGVMGMSPPEVGPPGVNGITFEEEPAAPRGVIGIEKGFRVLD